MLVDEIKQMIIDDLNLEDMKISDIDENAPLFGEGLGLDSVDALEIGLSVQRRFNITLDPKTHDVKEIYKSVKTLADFIEKSRSEK